MARKPIARYTVTAGLSGCYMPDAHYGSDEFHRRTELADAIRCYIDMQDFPKSAFTQANIIQLWQFIKRNGSSSAHFRITHKQFEIAFHGLTEDEFNEAQREEER